MSPDERNYLGWAMKLYKEGSYESVEGKPIVKVPPLYVYCLAFSFRLFGPSMDAAQGVSLFFGCLGVLLCYQFGQRIWGWKVGLMAAVLLLVSCKGEYWRYSNRVLNEIPLGFFLLGVLYFTCSYVRKPSWWNAGGVGLSLGLGLLTKEFAVLLVPIAGLALVLAKEKCSRKVFHLAIAVSVLSILVLPWLAHVAQITGSPLGGVAQRGQGQAVEIIKSAKSWGIRPIEDWLDMITLYDRPAWLSQFVMITSIGYGLWRFLRNRELETGFLVLSILVFWCTFGFFVALPVDLRRFVPVLPIYSLLAAVLLIRFWPFFLDRIKRLGLRIPHESKVGIALFILFCVNSLKPGLLMHKFDPFKLFSARKDFFLLAESEAAVRCVPAGSTILTNYPSIFYFYTQGTHPVRALRTTMGPGNGPSRLATGRSKEIQGTLLYDFEFGRKRAVITREFVEKEVEKSGASYLIFFRTGHPKAAPKALDEFFMARPEIYFPLCQDERYVVYEIKRPR